MARIFKDKRCILSSMSLMIMAAAFFLPQCRSTDQQPIQHRRPLPEKVIVGYMYWSTCNDSVLKAVSEGVNVVIWFAINIIREEGYEEEEEGRNVGGSLSNDSPVGTTRRDTLAMMQSTNNVSAAPGGDRIRVVGGPDLSCVQSYIDKLDRLGYDDVVHLISFGGWDTPHFDTSFPAQDMYQAWKDYGGDLFHGFDWDFEGNDKLTSPINVFTVECLERMGQMSALAKQDGYVVTMAPPESYLDLSTSRFSRYVNLTYPNDPWNPTFSYHGANAYAYVLAKYGHAIDLISVQLYESYSHAAYAITQLNIEASDYLVNYVLTLWEGAGEGRREGYVVDFTQDPTINLSRMFVPVPLNKLAFGLANGRGKGAFVTTTEAGMAYRELSAVFGEKASIRGFMFWNICAEGTGKEDFASGLNKFMKIRAS